MWQALPGEMKNVNVTHFQRHSTLISRVIENVTTHFFVDPDVKVNEN